MKFLLPSLFIFLLFIARAHAASPGDVVINEIAWMGTTNYHGDEWMELYNNTEGPISLEGWVLGSTDGKPNISLGGVVSSGDFFLLERTDDTSVSDKQADQIYTGVLGNSGEHLELLDAQGNLIDNVNAWGKVLWEGFGGDNETKHTMERKDPKLAGSDHGNWATSADAGGTPKAQNSIYIVQNSPISDPPPSPSLPSPPAPPSESTATSTPQSSPPPPDGADGGSAAGQAQPATSTLVELPPPTYPSNIFINEIMPSPLGPDELEEWIEIINESDETADISEWQIKDTLGNISTYILGTIMPAKSFIVLSRPTTKITMNNDNDAIQLIRPDGELIQTVPYKKAPKGKSYVRSKGVWKWSSVPTPGSTNIVPAPPKQTGTIEDVKKVIKKTMTTNSNSATTTTNDSVVAPSSSSSLTVAIGNAAPQNQNTFVYIIAPLIALLSAAFVFLLKKRLS